MENFTKKEIAFLKKINTPLKVQDFLNSLKFNFEKDEKGFVKDTFKSPLRVLREGNAHCIEGAVLGAFMLSLQGYKPLLLHLKTTKNDFDHVVAPFKKDGYWGALSKTNHSVLRYRDPIYKNIRELALSYFHEYFLTNGSKTLRQYSDVLDLNIFEDNWKNEMQDMWGIDEELDKIKHYDILNKKNINKLRKADAIEIQASNVVEYKDAL
ncbi:hypothetical protein K8Q94_01610 [Candidatus Nomurabacteria bacterium]|nr:hypothetical protein [Candidatus Nomurabacteria bacterium]